MLRRSVVNPFQKTADRDALNKVITRYIFHKEAPTANRGPNAVLVDYLPGCLSTIQLKPNNFGAGECFSTSKVLDGSYPAIAWALNTEEGH